MIDRKLGLDRSQYGFLKDNDAMDQFEILFDRSNRAMTFRDGGGTTGTTTIDDINVGQSISGIYSAVGGTLTVNLPAVGNFNLVAMVTVNNTFTTSPNTKVGRNVAGGSAIVSGMASGSTLYVSLTRIS